MNLSGLEQDELNNHHEEEEEEVEEEVEQHDEEAPNDDNEDEEETEAEHTELESSKVDENNVADNDSDEDFDGFGEEEIKVATKKRQILSDDSDQEEGINTSKKLKSKRALNSDDDDEQEEAEQIEELEEEEEEDEDLINPAQKTKETDEETEQNEVEDEPVKKKRDKPSEVDLMLQKSKAQNAKNRRKKNQDSEEINDMDNKISMIISEMKNVAAEDRAANEKSLTTLQKIKMLPTVMNMLQKSDYHATMIELGVLGAIAEWLAPLPDRSLPNIKIREFLIETLRDFGEINVDYLKSSGVGKAVMFLYKHSKETKENKLKLEKLINNWSRPIFNLDGNFKQLTKEERLQRDMDHVKMMSKRNSNEFNQGQTIDDLLDATDSHKTKKIKKKIDTNNQKAPEESKKFLRPGDAGFCPRARVPIPSSKDYVIRPKSNVESMETSSSTKKMKKTENRLDKHKKRFEEIKKNSKSSRAVTMVAAGGK